LYQTFKSNADCLKGHDRILEPEQSGLCLPQGLLPFENFGPLRLKRGPSRRKGWVHPDKSAHITLLGGYLQQSDQSISSTQKVLMP